MPLLSYLKKAGIARGAAGNLRTPRCDLPSIVVTSTLNVPLHRTETSLSELGFPGRESLSSIQP